MATASVAAEPTRFETRTWAQDRILQSTAPEVAVSGGLYSGKTAPACLVALAEADKNPGALILLCRAERASMTASTVVSLKKLLPGWLQTWDGRRQHGWKESESTLYWPRRDGRQSTIVCIGLDDAQRLQSINAHIVVIDQGEQITLEQYLFADGRSARQPEFANGRTVILFNPDYPEHWANQRWNFSLGSREIADPATGKVVAEVVVCDPDDVKQFADERYLAKLDRMTGAWRARYRLNRWTGFEGQVFEKWNPDVHLVYGPGHPECVAGRQACPPALRCWEKWAGYPPPNWPRYRGIDFGYWPDPFAMGWIAESPEKKLYVYRQTYMTKRLVEDHARQAVELEREELLALRGAADEDDARAYEAQLAGLQIDGSWADHDREDRETWARHGIWSTPANKSDLIAGVKTLIGLLDPDQPGGSRLFILRDSLVERDPNLYGAEPRRPCSLEEEMGGYRWNKDSIAKRNLPVDKDNHAIDWLKYLCHSLGVSVPIGVYG